MASSSIYLQTHTSATQFSRSTSTSSSGSCTAGILLCLRFVTLSSALSMQKIHLMQHSRHPMRIETAKRPARSRRISVSSSDIVEFILSYLTLLSWMLQNLVLVFFLKICSKDQYSSSCCFSISTVYELCFNDPICLLQEQRCNLLQLLLALLLLPHSSFCINSMAAKSSLWWKYLNWPSTARVINTASTTGIDDKLTQHSTGFRSCIQHTS